MTLPQWIGEGCLIASFLLYLVVYSPQLIHNRKKTQIEQLSLSMHYLLYIGYLFDVLYGWYTHLPWQYLSVASIGYIFLTIQNTQLSRHFYLKNQKKRACWINLVSICSTLCLMIALYTDLNHALTPAFNVSIFGWIAHVLFTICFFPQCFKNQFNQSSDALNEFFLMIEISATSLDLCAAWCLHWGWPNKVGPFVILIPLILLFIKRDIKSHGTANQLENC